MAFFQSTAPELKRIIKEAAESLLMLASSTPLPDPVSTESGNECDLNELLTTPIFDTRSISSGTVVAAQTDGEGSDPGPMLSSDNDSECLLDSPPPPPFSPTQASPDRSAVWNADSASDYVGSSTNEGNDGEESRYTPTRSNDTDSSHLMDSPRVQISPIQPAASNTRSVWESTVRSNEATSDEGSRYTPKLDSDIEMPYLLEPLPPPALVSPISPVLSSMLCASSVPKHSNSPINELRAGERADRGPTQGSDIIKQWLLKSFIPSSPPSSPMAKVSPTLSALGVTPGISKQSCGPINGLLLPNGVARQEQAFSFPVYSPDALGARQSNAELPSTWNHGATDRTALSGSDTDQETALGFTPFRLHFLELPYGVSHEQITLKLCSSFDLRKLLPDNHSISLLIGIVEVPNGQLSILGKHDGSKHPFRYLVSFKVCWGWFFIHSHTVFELRLRSRSGALTTQTQLTFTPRTAQQEDSPIQATSEPNGKAPEERFLSTFIQPTASTLPDPSPDTLVGRKRKVRDEKENIGREYDHRHSKAFRDQDHSRS